MILTPDNLGKNQQCQICDLARDEMSHVLDCVVVKLACPSLLYIEEKISIEDAYSDNIDKMKRLAVLFKKAWRTRESILKR